MQANLKKPLCSGPDMLIIDFLRLCGSYRSRLVAIGTKRQERLTSFKRHCFLNRP